MTRTRTTVLETLERSKSVLRRLGVRRLGLFGSIARDEAREASDLDFVVELDEKTFDRYMDLKLYLEDLFGAARRGPGRPPKVEWKRCWRVCAAGLPASILLLKFA